MVGRLRMLDRKLLRDLWHLRGQMTAIATVVACGVAVVMTTRTSYTSLLASRASYYRDERFADRTPAGPEVIGELKAEVAYLKTNGRVQEATLRSLGRRYLLRRIEEIDNWTLRCPIRVRSKVSYAIDEPPSAISTVGREMMFCIVHAIHHYALIAVMCGILEVSVPAGFGVAPSTLKYHAEQPKAA